VRFADLRLSSIANWGVAGGVGDGSGGIFGTKSGTLGLKDVEQSPHE
jgi:hypothetical protein